jgi:hypothetical protein
VDVHSQGAAVSPPAVALAKAGGPPPMVFRESEIARGTGISKDFLYKLTCPFRLHPPTLPVHHSMKIYILLCALNTTFSLSLQAGTPAEEKAFTDKYKTAFEVKDTATLESFLYTQGADPEILGFYKMMQTGDAGEKIAKIELVDLKPEDVKKAETPMDSPTGGKVCLTLKPSKKLIIKIEKKDSSGSSTSSSESFIAEKDGKFVIPVPGPCK